MAIIFHTTCRSPLYADLGGKVSLLGEINIGKKGLAVISFSLTLKEPVERGDLIIENVELYCPAHQTRITDINEIGVECSWCGRPMKIKDAKFPMKSGGVACKDHWEVFKEKENSYSWETILKHLIVY